MESVWQCLVQPVVSRCHSSLHNGCLASSRFHNEAPSLGLEETNGEDSDSITSSPNLQPNARADFTIFYLSSVRSACLIPIANIVSRNQILGLPRIVFQPL